MSILSTKLLTNLSLNRYIDTFVDISTPVATLYLKWLKSHKNKKAHEIAPSFHFFFHGIAFSNIFRCSITSFENITVRDPVTKMELCSFLKGKKYPIFLWLALSAYSVYADNFYPHIVYMQIIVYPHIHYMRIKNMAWILYPHIVCRNTIS